MNKVAKFHKVSYEQFRKDWLDTFTWSDMAAFGILPIRFTDPDTCAMEKALQDLYRNIKLPKRATSGSAGYDFYSPMNFTLKPGSSIKIPTGIRCEISNGWMLLCMPKSGLGTKFRMQLDNTVGLIDSDYYHADNEGHIMLKVTNDSKEYKNIDVRACRGFAQGVFIPYGITEDDNEKCIRRGGFGSTNA